MPARSFGRSLAISWADAAGADTRSLALFRVAFGSVLAYDIAARFPHIDDFYTDWGVLPRAPLTELILGPWEWSLHLFSGQWGLQLALFVAGLLFAVGFTLGYRTRLCAFLSWIFVCSLHVRNPAVTHGGDDLMRLLLLWCWLVPLNTRYSLDRALNPDAPAGPSNHLSLGGLALLLQLAFMYWFSALLKWHPVWHTEGTAIYYALSLDQFAKPLGHFLLQFPGLLKLLTHFTLAWEFIGPLLAFSPIWNGPLRTLVVLSFIAFHAGLAATLELGPFPWTCAAAWLAFLPTWFWDRWALRADAKALAATTVFFDGDCGFCRKSVRILREILLLDGLKLREAQEVARVETLMRQKASWVVEDREGRLRTGYDAFVVLIRLSPLLRRAANIFDARWMRAIGERAYRLVADHRVQSSRILKGVQPPAPVSEYGLPTMVAAVVFLAVAVFYNLTHFESLRLKTSAGLHAFMSVTQTFQKWNLFAPFPTRDDGWYAIQGTLKSGHRVELTTGGPFTLQKPDDVAATYRDVYWRKYLTNLWYRRYTDYRLYFGRYLCRVWNEKHSGEDQVDLIHIYYMHEYNPPPGEPEPEAEQDLVWRHYCFEKPADW